MLKTIAKRGMRVLGYKITRDPAPIFVSDRVRALITAMWPVSTDLPLVRFGGAGDGAYLIPDDLDGITALFSPGVDTKSTFENEMTAKGMRCYLADASVSGPGVDNPAFHFDPKFLGLRNEGDIVTIDHWVDSHEPGSDDLMLQMDIEGAEWTVLSNMSDQLLRRFRIIAIEFHAMSLVFRPYAEQIVIDVLERLLATHHVVHNHPNNAAWTNLGTTLEIPEVIEVTFLRKDRAKPTGFARQFPHPLDILNDPAKPQLVLPAAWHE